MPMKIVPPFGIKLFVLKEAWVSKLSKSDGINTGHQSVDIHLRDGNIVRLTVYMCEFIKLPIDFDENDILDITLAKN